MPCQDWAFSKPLKKTIPYADDLPYPDGQSQLRAANEMRFEKEGAKNQKTAEAFLLCEIRKGHEDLSVLGGDVSAERYYGQAVLEIENLNPAQGDRQRRQDRFMDK